MQGYWLAVAVVTLVACEVRVLEQPDFDRGSGPPGLSAATDAQQYAPGDAVRLTIVNDTDNEFWFNVCWDEMERWQSGAWLPVRPERVCIAIAHVLPARETVNAAYPLEDDLAEGSETVLVRSNAFRIAR